MCPPLVFGAQKKPGLDRVKMKEFFGGGPQTPAFFGTQIKSALGKPLR